MIELIEKLIPRLKRNVYNKMSHETNSENKYAVVFRYLWGYTPTPPADV